MLRWRGFSGVALPPFGIYILEERLTDEALIRHEMAHWQQAQRMGIARWYLTYAWLTMRHGYRNNPLEVEAREAETRSVHGV